MKKIIIVIGLLFMSCVSFPDTNPPENIPSASLEGCKIYSKDRIKYQSCITNVRQLWALRESSNVELSIIEEKRYNDTWVIKTYQHCRHDFCDKFEVSIKDETLWGQIQNNSWFVLIGTIIGIGIGAGI